MDIPMLALANIEIDRVERSVEAVVFTRRTGRVVGEHIERISRHRSPIGGLHGVVIRAHSISQENELNEMIRSTY